jgi:glyoxylate carboligase
MPTAPFLVGTPLPPERFVGRQLALQIVRGRLYNGESTALVGGPHIGKTSLLLYLARELCNAPNTPDVCVEIDGHLISAGAQPSDFWAVVVNQVAELVHDPVVQLQVERVIESEFGSFVLERLFRLMARAGRRAVLLIDEFDALLAHANFNAAEFLGRCGHCRAARMAWW